MDGGESPELLATARALGADLAGAEVVAAWRAAGIEPVLLKGPTLADWLYPGELRPYGDTDLLVAPAEIWSAATILERLGFQPYASHQSFHAHPWIRTTDGATIDLHVNLWGADRPPERVWRELRRWVEHGLLAGVPVLTLGLPARALYVTLHAAQHDEEGKPVEDLRRALERTPIAAWRDAERLADRIGALGFMAKGLSRRPEGVAVAEQLPLVVACLRTQDGAPLAIGFARFAQARGVRAKLGVVAGSLTRPPDEYGPDRPDSTDSTGLGIRIRHAALLLGSAVRTLVALHRRRAR